MTTIVAPPWEEQPTGGGIADAPTDGKTYGRKDAAWAEVVSVGGPAILDSERYSLERATGGQQTIIRDSAGNANAMFVLPRGHVREPWVSPRLCLSTES
jgi:hypothetical protein